VISSARRLMFTGYLFDELSIKLKEEEEEEEEEEKIWRFRPVGLEMLILSKIINVMMFDYIEQKMWVKCLYNKDIFTRDGRFLGT
jgi:hypothetical protein